MDSRKEIDTLTNELAKQLRLSSSFTPIRVINSGRVPPPPPPSPKPHRIKYKGKRKANRPSRLDLSVIDRIDSSNRFRQIENILGAPRKRKRCDSMETQCPSPKKLF